MNAIVAYVLAEPMEEGEGWRVIRVTREAWTRERKLMVETATSTGETLLIKVMTCPSNMLDLWSAYTVGAMADEIWKRIKAQVEVQA